MNQPTRLPGAALAQELTDAGRVEGAHTPFDLVLQAARRGELDEAAHYRLLGRLWVLKRCARKTPCTSICTTSSTGSRW